MGRSFEVRKASMAKTAGAKIKVYSKYGKEIYMCAKNGGGDPDMNLSLKHLIAKAKKDQVPAHVIDKAIDKANGGGGEDYTPARYEGFGPGGTSVIVDCLTDNGNRTFQDVRQCFVKVGAKIGFREDSELLQSDAGEVGVVRSFGAGNGSVGRQVSRVDSQRVGHPRRHLEFGQALKTGYVEDSPDDGANVNQR